MTAAQTTLKKQGGLFGDVIIAKLRKYFIMQNFLRLAGVFAVKVDKYACKKSVQKTFIEIQTHPFRLIYSKYTFEMYFP